jgi:hypothetical protein
MAGEAIFVGYRRDDTADVAGRIFDALEARFGRDRVFKDVDNIPIGANFGLYIKNILPRCRAALILMGPGWSDARDGSGGRRLEDSNDWVRLEVETALAVPDLQIIPVLVNGAQIPSLEELPPSLQPLLHLNAAVVRRDPDFRSDFDRLANSLVDLGLHPQEISNRSQALKALGLGEGASAEDVKKTYRKLAMKYHPDVVPGDQEAETVFERVNLAFRYLLETEQKTKRSWWE